MILKKSLPPPFQRPLWVSTRSHRSYFFRSLGRVHADLLQAVERWVPPGAVVWDIGANMGVFSFASALRAGPAGAVYAFEADVACAALMSRSLELKVREEAPITICPFAIAAASGPLAFEISHYRSAASSIQGFGWFPNGGSVRSVPAFAIDDLASAYTAPTLIKIDVERAENLVLRGARKTLERLRPTLLIECSGGETGAETAEFLRTLNYEWKPWLSEGAFGQEAPLSGDIVTRWRQAI